MSRLVLFAAALSLHACQEYELQGERDRPGGADPAIEVTPESLIFGAQLSTEVTVQSFTVANVGDAPLTVSNVWIDAGVESFTLLSQVDELVLDPGDDKSYDVAFTPYGSINEGTALVASDDPDRPEVPVALEGYGEVPELLIDPAYYQFPTECEDEVALILQNVGLEPLIIDGISYDGTPGLQLVDDNVLPLTLLPTEKTSVVVHYLPADVGAEYGTLEVSSNDPRGVQTAEQVAETGLGDEITEQFTIIDDPPLDVLFALDKSGSMVEEAWNLAAAFSQFISEIDTATLDWQIGVVTKDTGCFNSGIITAATPDYETVFSNAVGGIILLQDDLTEQLLELSHVALTQTVPGACNEGFARPDAVLHIVTVSDEPEQSGVLWSDWVNEFQSHMPDPNLLMISGVVDLYNDCGTLGTGYIEAAQATNGVLLDVCNSDWGAYASQLGAASAANLRTVYLAATPDPSTIVVTLGDGSVYTDWHYDPAANAVVIDGDLPAGTVVNVTYTAVGC